MAVKPDAIVCNDGCKRTQPDSETALAASWTLLQITGRWRCPDCRRVLAEANKPRENP